MTRDEKVNFALSLLDFGPLTPVTWTWDDNTWVPSRPEGVSERVYNRAVAAVQVELARVQRKRKSPDIILEWVNGLNGSQRSALLNAILTAAKASKDPLMRALGGNLWVLQGNATLGPRAAAIFLWEFVSFARDSGYDFDGDEPEE